MRCCDPGRRCFRPEEGTIGNKSLRARLRWSEATYEKIKWQLLDDGEIALGRGKGGSVSRAVGPSRKRGKLKISRSKGPVMRIESAAFEAQGIVYVLVANRQIKYRKRRSSIVYIGTSCGGASRVAASMVERAATAFAKRGVSTVYAQVLTSSGKQGVRTWKELEAAAIETFEQTRGELPLCNKRNEGSLKSEEEIYRHYNRQAVLSALDDIDSWKTSYE